MTSRRRRLAAACAAALLLLSAASGAAQEEQEEAQEAAHAEAEADAPQAELNEDVLRAVATAAEIAGRRDTEAREAQAAAAAAQREATEARQRADAAADRARALEEQANATEAERDAAREEAEALRAEAAEKEDARTALAEQASAAETRAEEAQARAAELEQELAQRERRYYGTLIGAAVLLLLLALAAWLFARRRRMKWEAARREADARYAEAVVPAPFSCLLEGGGEEGRSVVVKVGAEQLGAPDGVVVGRSPDQAGVVLDHPEASREHFRLVAKDGALFIVDLHSTNGTFVNGNEIGADEETALSPGDEIGVGAAIRLTLSTTKS